MSDKFAFARRLEVAARPLITHHSSRIAALTASTPGRICLFGEHVDYLGLPGIAAIDRGITHTRQLSHSLSPNGVNRRPALVHPIQRVRCADDLVRTFGPLNDPFANVRYPL